MVDSGLNFGYEKYMRTCFHGIVELLKNSFWQISYHRFTKKTRASRTTGVQGNKFLQEMASFR